MLHCCVDIEQTYAEYEGWIEGAVDEVTRRKYEQALGQLQRLRPLEAALVRLDQSQRFVLCLPNLLAVYSQNFIKQFFIDFFIT